MDAFRCRQAIRHFHQFGRCGNQTDVFCFQYLRGVSRNRESTIALSINFFFAVDARFISNLYLTLQEHTWHLARCI